MLFGSGMPRAEQMMDPELRRIDEVLDDDGIVDHVVQILRKRWPNSARKGRGSTPAEVVLRLLVLKHLRRWSYQQLEWEVTGNLAYRHFARIELGKVPMRRRCCATANSSTRRHCGRSSIASCIAPPKLE
jgi:IS5 family transposase